MNSDIFSFDDYRAFIKSRVKDETPKWGAWARLARAANCQATYLSQAMKGKVHLTSDHVHAIALFWKLNASETDFFLLQLEHAKAGSRSLREYLLNRIKRLRSEHTDLTKRFSVNQIESGEKESMYYSSWHWAALHIIVTIPDLQTVPAISQRLQLPVAFVEFSLEKLKHLGFVKKDGPLWKLSIADVHISKNSPMIALHHNNWRQRAVVDAMLPQKEKSLHFTGVYSLSRADFEHLKGKMLDLVEHTRRVVAPSKEEELACVLCDIFLV